MQETYIVFSAFKNGGKYIWFWLIGMRNNSLFWWDYVDCSMDFQFICSFCVSKLLPMNGFRILKQETNVETVNISKPLTYCMNIFHLFIQQTSSAPAC